MMPGTHEWIGERLSDLAGMPTWTQLIGIAILLVGMLFTGFSFVIGTMSLPDKIEAVSEVADRADSVSSHLQTDMETGFTRIDRNFDQVDTKLNRILCIQEAERGERSYESCLRN